MKFNCTLSPSQIDNLYKLAYKAMHAKMSKGEEFQAEPFIKDVYDSIAQKKDHNTAAKFVQILPGLTYAIAAKPEFRSLDIKTDPIREMIRQFENVETGINDIIKKYSEDIDPKELKEKVKDKKKEAEVIKQIESPEALQKQTEVRLVPYTVFGTTMQEFDPKDPNKKKELDVERVNEETEYIFTTIRKINESMSPEALPTEVVYQGKTIKLKPMKVWDIPAEQRDSHTNSQMQQGARMIKDGTHKPEVTRADERLALVVTDQYGRPLSFDEEGNIVETGGKWVYQFLRTIRKVGDRYTAKGMYNTDSQVLSPELIAMRIMEDSGLSEAQFEEAQDMSFSAFVAKIDKQQQEDFKALYKFSQDFLKTGDTQLLEMSGLNIGLPYIGGGKTYSLRELHNKLPKDAQRQMYTTLSAATANVTGQRKGYTYTIIDGNKLAVDRPLLPETIALKIGKALTDPNLSARDKYDYITQFFPAEYAKLTQSARNYEFKYNRENDEFIFSISPEVGKPPVRVDLTDQANAQYITERLLTGMKHGNAVRQVLMPELIAGNYFDYQNGELVEADYIEDVLSKSPAQISFAPDTDIFGAYMQYTLPNKYTEEQQQAEEELTEPEYQPFIEGPSSEIRRSKDQLHSKLENLDSKDKVLQGRVTTVYQENYWIEVDGISVKVRAPYELRKKGKSAAPAKDIVYEGMAVNVQIAPPSGPEGMYDETIEVFANGTKLGNVAETDESAGEVNRDAYYKHKLTQKQAQEVQKQKAEEKLNPPGTTNPNSAWSEDDEISLDRSRFHESYAENLTKEDVKKAEEWWANSPLNKYISLQQMTNIVNSDAFAKFFASGQTLYEDGKLGKIAVYKDGTMVDVYHEAWHGFSQLFLTKAEKTALYNEIISKGGKYKNMTFKQIEEELAEDFRTYAKGQKTKKDSPKRNSIFRKIWNFIKTWFSKISKKSTATANVYEIPAVKELFDKLYFASKNPSLLNEYTPMIDNVMFDELNRGIAQVRNPKEDALNVQDSMLIVDTMDSIISELIDDYHDEIVKGSTKAGALALLSQTASPKGVQNRAVLYKKVKARLEERIETLRNELGATSAIPFSNMESLADIKKNAVAVMKHEDGDDKYIFLRSQIDSFNSLNLNSKQGERNKGERYKGTIDIIGDFYTHEKINNPTKRKVGIIVVDTIDNATAQYNNYIEGGARKYTGLEVAEKPPVSRELTREEAKLQDDIRILEAAVKNMRFSTNTETVLVDGVPQEKEVTTANTKKGTFQYYNEHSRFNVVKTKVTTVEEELEQEDEEQSIDGDPNTKLEEMSGINKLGKKTLEESADNEAIYIVKSLFKIGADGKSRVKNRLGFYELADFGTVWNAITRAIGGVKDPQEVYDKLHDPTLLRSFPELRQLIEKKLPNPAKTAQAQGSSREFDITTAFWQSFKKPRVPYKQASVIGEGTEAEIKVTTSTYESGVLVRSYSTNFKTIVPDSKNYPYVSRVDNKNRLILSNEFLKEFANKDGVFKVSKSVAFANAMGINLDDIRPIKKELELHADRYGLPFMFDAIKAIAKTERALAKKLTLTEKEKRMAYEIDQFKQDPVGAFRRGISKDIAGKPYEERTQIDRLAELHMKYGVEYANFSVLNAEGKKVNEHIEDHTASMKVDGLNRAQKLSDLWQRPDLQFMSFLNPEFNTFTMRSQMIKHLFRMQTAEKEKADGKSILLTNVSGTQNFNTKEGVNTTSLDYYGKYLQEMNTMLLDGLQEFMRHASKSSSFGIQAMGKIAGQRGKTEDHLYVGIDSMVDNGGGIEYAFNNIILPYILGEHERTVRVKNNKELFKTYKGYNLPVIDPVTGNKVMAGEIFTVFDDVLTDDTKRELYEIENLEEELKTNSDLKNRLAADVKKYFERQVEINLEILRKNNYINPTLRNKLKVFGLTEAAEEEVLVRTFTYNSWIHNFETLILMYGDPAQVNHAKEEQHKRSSGLTSTGDGFRSDQAAQDFINNHWSKGSYATKLGKQNFHFDGKMNTAVTEDVTRKSVHVDSIRKVWKEDYKNRFKDVSKENFMKALSEKDLAKLGANPTKAALRDAFIERRIEAEIDEYLGMTEGDGQGLITFDAYRTLRKLANKWSDPQESLFQDIIAGKKVDANEIKELFPVYKLQYYGNIEGTQLPVNAMHKFSLMPLIPTMIEGSDMQTLHEHMMDSDIQYMTFESGSKVGSVSKDGTPDKLYADENYTEFLGKNIEFTPNTIYMEYLKDVTVVPKKFKGKTIFATQLRKIILQDLYNNGEPVHPAHVKALARYDKAVQEYSDILEAELLEDIGFQYDENGNLVGNLGQFLSVVQKQLGLKDVPEHLIRFVGVTTKNTLKTDLSYHLEADTIEKILLGLFEKKLIKQKVNGEALVQVASSMTNGIWDESGLRKDFKVAKGEEAKKYLTTNNLPFYQQIDGETKAMKVAIALQGNFTNLLNLKDNEGETIGTREKLNELIKDEQWLNTKQEGVEATNRDAITLAGVRIPTQTLGFIESMEVYEFLDPAASNIIILPTEIVVKNGSDFDVDKLTTFMPNLNKNGTFVKHLGDNSQVLANAAVLRSQNKNKEAKALIREQKLGLENELIQSISDIVKLPENFPALLKPTHTIDLKEIADDLAQYVDTFDRFALVHGEPGQQRVNTKGGKSISPTRTLEVAYNLHKHQVNLEGMDVLGIAANEDALHSVYNQVGAKMPATYKAQVYSGNGYVDTPITYDMRLHLPHNTKDGRISLSDINTQDGLYRIADLFSQAMNGLVDVEKDAWVFYIQANPEIANTLFYLFKAGVSPKDAIYFLSNPLVREYAENQRLYKSAYAAQTGKVLSSPTVLQYQSAEDVITNRFSEKEIEEMMKSINREKLNDVVSHMTKPASVLFQLPDGKKLGPEQSRVLTPERLKNAIKKGAFIKSIRPMSGPLAGAQIYKPTGGLASRANYYYASSLATSKQDILDKSGNFDRDKMYDLIKTGVTAKNRDFALAGFLHFLEIEKQTRGLQKLKRASKPDTTTSKTMQEITARQLLMEELMNDSTVDPELVRALQEDSVLKSFFKGDLVKNMIKPLFKLRNNDAITDFVIERASHPAVRNAFGSGAEEISQYIRAYKNAVVNYVFQNTMSNFTDSKGRVVDYTDSYKGLDIKTTTKAIPGNVKVDKKADGTGTITINPEAIRKAFDDQAFIEDGTFMEDDNPFPPGKKSSYFKFIIEKALIEATSPKASQEAVIKRALLNSFNHHYLTKMQAYSFTEDMKTLVNKHSSLGETYPIINQITDADNMLGYKVLTLADKDRVKGDVATSYYHNIRALADMNIQKVKDEKENRYISQMFTLFPLIALYQHGIGYSKNSFNSALPFDDFVLLTVHQGDLFMENSMNENTLKLINDRLLQSEPYKDYVIDQDTAEGMGASDKEGTMFFPYHGNKRDDVTADTTFNAILKGERTATTRAIDDEAYKYWSNTKVGDIIKFWSGTAVGSGDFVNVRVTSVKPVDLAAMNEQEKEEWSKAEGWSVHYLNQLVQARKEPSGLQIQFELVDSSAEVNATTDPEDVPAKRLDISSKSKGLGAVLTNPTEIALRNGNLRKSYPVTFEGKEYIDAEKAYQMNKGKYNQEGKAKGSTYELMVNILEAKLNQYPDIVAAVEKEGGINMLKNAVHQPTSKNTIWETGGENYFIDALVEAYNKVVSSTLTTPEIVAAGTSPYRGRIRTTTIGGKAEFIEGSTTVKEAIKSAIKQNKAPVLSGILKSYLKLIDPAILNRNVFGSRDIIKDDGFGTLGISAATEFLLLARVSEAQKATDLTERQTQTMVHELTHMLTLQPFIKESDGKALTEKEKEFITEMKKLYDHVLSLPETKAAGYMRGKADVYEFIADAISDEEFRNFLNNIPYTEGKTVLSKLIDFIKKLLQVKSGSALETVVDQVYSLREDPSFKHYSTLHHLVSEFAPLDSKIGQSYFKTKESTDQNIPTKEVKLTPEIREKYIGIVTYYESLDSEKQKELGTLEELIEEYENESLSNTQGEFIEELKCR